MKQFISQMTIATSIFAFTALPAFAATNSYEPWMHDQDSIGSAIAELSAHGELMPEKNALTLTIFPADQTDGGVLLPENETILGIDIVMDEEGQSTLNTIQVDGQDVVVNTLPSDKEACKKGGWTHYTATSGNAFKNQGQRVSYLAKMQHD